MKFTRPVLVLATSALLALATFAPTRMFAQPAASGDTIEIRYADRRFTPLEIEVPAQQALTLKVINTSKERIEFESFRLNREKVVGPGETLVLHLPPLKAGSYDFFDDFHDNVPEGTIVAR